MLSFEIINSGRGIQICCDDQGINTLMAALNKLRGSGDHTHLLTPSCGGRELSETNPLGTPAIPEVIITHGGD